jgi:hypothetical protein
MMTSPSTASEAEFIRLHEDVFYAYFKPYRHPESKWGVWDGNGIETFGDDWELVNRLDKNHVWTLVDDSEGGGQTIMEGIHYVNRLCYLVTEIPHGFINVDFHCPRCIYSLTPLGFKRQLNRLLRRVGFHQLHNVGR